MKQSLFPPSILLLLIALSSCEEWYFPNSRMISDLQYKEHIINDHTTYKLVKFFTPHCQFCRYLKDVIDTLKAEKHWQFEIYDFNCAWYPAVCNQLKAYSFPFTAVFNPQGEVETTIVGFYPYPIIKEHFERIQESSIKFKAPKEEVKTEVLSNLGQEVHEEVKEQAPTPKEESQPVAEPEKKEKHHEQVHPQQTVIPNQKEVQPQPKHQDPHHNPPPQHLSGISQHVFYAICFFLGVVYFTHFSNPKKPPQSKSHPKINPQSPKETHHQKHTFDDMIS